MRIALVHLGRRGSGGPISFELATHLSSMADLFVVLSVHVENLDLWTSSGIDHTTVRTYRTVPGAIWYLFSMLTGRKIARQVRSWRPDVLLFPMFYTMNPFLQWQLRSIPGVVIVHDPVPHPGIAGRVYRQLEDLSIRQAQECVILSHSLVAEMTDRGAEPDRIQVIPHGEFSYFRRHYPADPNNKVDKEDTFLFFGRITPYKGLGVLLHAYRELRKQHPARLVIVGEGDINPYNPLLEGLPDVRVINRWVDESEVAGFFNQASFVVLPYLSASQSGVLPIAASFALPVIATRVGGIPEQIEHEVTGLLVEPGSSDELAAAMQRLSQDPQFSRQLGENLRRDYQENKNWEVIAAELFEICTLARHADLTNS